MLEPLDNPFWYFMGDSVRRWNFWLGLGSIIAFTTLICHESTSGEVTRRSYILKLNIFNYAMILMAAIFIPATYKGDGRFWGFFLSANGMFILYYLTQFNPYYLASTNYPALEAMNNCKLLTFSLIELVFVCCLAAGHIAYGYYFTNVNVMNVKWYHNLSVSARERSSEYFSNICLMPAITYCYIALLQLIVRCALMIRDKSFYDDETNESLRPKIKQFKKEQSAQKRITSMIMDRINKKKQQSNYE